MKKHLFSLKRTLQGTISLVFATSLCFQTSGCRLDSITPNQNTPQSDSTLETYTPPSQEQKNETPPEEIKLPPYDPNENKEKEQTSSGRRSLLFDGKI